MLRLKTTCAPNPRITPIANGEVKVEGVEFDWNLTPVPMLFRNNIALDNPELSEMSISETMLTVDRKEQVRQGPLELVGRADLSGTRPLLGRHRRQHGLRHQGPERPQGQERRRAGLLHDGRAVDAHLAQGPLRHRDEGQRVVQPAPEGGESGHRPRARGRPAARRHRHLGDPRRPHRHAGARRARRGDRCPRACASRTAARFTSCSTTTAPR